MTAVVHHSINSRSQRVLWLLEELGVEYEVKHYERDRRTLLESADLTAVHPLGKSPVIAIDGQLLAETGPIVSYLVANYGQGRLIPPVGSAERLRYIFYRHHADGTALPPLVTERMLTEAPESGQLPFFLRPVARMLFGAAVKCHIDPQIDNLIAFWASELKKSRYFAGDELTCADIVMSFPLELAATRAKLPPRISEYLEDIHGRPAYRQALTRGDLFR